MLWNFKIHGDRLRASSVHDKEASSRIENPMITFVGNPINSAAPNVLFMIEVNPVAQFDNRSFFGMK